MDCEWRCAWGASSGPNSPVIARSFLPSTRGVLESEPAGDVELASQSESFSSSTCEQVVTRDAGSGHGLGIETELEQV